jgi:two-component sensor histidine kinase
MIGADQSDASAQRVLITAPFRRNAIALGDILSKHDVLSTVCLDANDLAQELKGEPAAVILSQEALTPRILEALSGYLTAQPDWSELPALLLLDADRQKSPLIARLRAYLPRCKLIVLQRPVRPLELVTSVQTAVAARRRQLQLRDHIALQEELQRELNHRVKNVLANVFAIFHMTMRQSASLEEFKAGFEGRLTALSSAHSALVMSSELQTIGEVAELILAPYRSSDVERVTIVGPPLAMRRGPAITLALCLHELATNAVKYGALSAPQGRVALEWSQQLDGGQALLRLRWTERDGPPVSAPSRRGYGTAFLRSAIASGMNGRIELSYLPLGLACEITAPLQAIVEAGSNDSPTADDAASAQEPTTPRGVM